MIFYEKQFDYERRLDQGSELMFVLACVAIRMLFVPATVVPLTSATRFTLISSALKSPLAARPFLFYRITMMTTGDSELGYCKGITGNCWIDVSSVPLVDLTFDHIEAQGHRNTEMGVFHVMTDSFRVSLKRNQVKCCAAKIVLVELWPV